jgi:hypothetical protein
MTRVRLLAALLLTTLAAPAPSLARPKDLAQAGHIRARWEVRQLRRAVRGTALQDLQAIKNGCTASVLAGRTAQGRAVVVRKVADPECASRLHNAFFILAHQIGAGDLVLPATTVSSGQLGGTAMVTAHAGSAFQPGNRAPADWLTRVAEEVRIKAALLDLLTAQQDRISKNLMVSARGEVRLIDHDFSLGHVHEWNHPSLFFPGRKLGYDPASLHDLPGPLRQLTTAIATADTAELMRRYGLDRAEARLMRARAQDVQRLGLTGAISALRSTGQRPLLLLASAMSVHSRAGYLRTGDTVKAIPGQSQPNHLVFGPYLRYAPGRYSIRFELRSATPAGRMATLEVNDAVSRRVLASRTLSAADFAAGQWREFELPVDVPAGDNALEFRVAWHGSADLEVAKIRVR